MPERCLGQFWILHLGRHKSIRKQGTPRLLHRMDGNIEPGRAGRKYQKNSCGRDEVLTKKDPAHSSIFDGMGGIVLHICFWKLTQRLHHNVLIVNYAFRIVSLKSKCSSVKLF